MRAELRRIAPELRCVRVGRLGVGAAAEQYAEDEVGEVARLHCVELRAALVVEDRGDAVGRLAAPAQHVEQREDVRLGREVQPRPHVALRRVDTFGAGERRRVDAVDALALVALGRHPREHVVVDLVEHRTRDLQPGEEEEVR